MTIRYTTTTDGVDWAALNKRLAADNFDNGRTTEQLRLSFENSAAVAFAWGADSIIAKGRAISDRVCNAYVVDVWTYSPFRRQGIGAEIMRQLLLRLPGQHVYLFTDEAQSFYERLGFTAHGTGLGMVVGQWLHNDTR